MLKRKTSTAPHKNELIHNRRWDDVVEVETELWKHNPQQGIIEIKANA